MAEDFDDQSYFDRRLKESTQEIGRLRIRVTELTKRNDELQAQKLRAEEQCEECRKTLFEQVLQHPDAAYTTIDGHIRKADEGKIQELDMHNEKLKQDLERSNKDFQAREASYKEKIKSLELECNQVSETSRQMQEKYNGEIRVLNESTSHYQDKLRESEIKYEELKEEYTIEVAELQRKLKELYEDYKKSEEKWKSKEEQWVIQKADLEGDLRAINNDLQEYKKKTSITPTVHPQTNYQNMRDYDSPTGAGVSINGGSNDSDSSPRINQPKSENVLSKEFGRLQRQLALLQERYDKAVKVKQQLDTHEFEKKTKPTIFHGVHIMPTIPGSETNSLSNN